MYFIAPDLFVQERGEKVTQNPLAQINCRESLAFKIEIERLRTSLILSEVEFLIEISLIRINLSIKAVVLFQSDRQLATPSVN